MITLYAIKNKNTGLYYSHRPVRGSWWGELADAKFYKTVATAQRIMSGGMGVSPRVAVALRRADPVVVRVLAEEQDDKNPL